MLFAIACTAGAAAFFVAVWVCSAIRGFALRHALLDRPNERSLHDTPVPRLGGVGILAGTVAGALVAWLPSPATPERDMRVWAGAALAVAALGLGDDLRSLRASVRLFLQIAFAAAFVALVGVPERFALANGAALSLPATIAGPLVVIWLIAVLNIYNFMDGMDGLAGTQAVGAGCALGAGFAAHGHLDLAALALAMAAGSAGFLLHNAPPARIFMGDAGSTFLGFGFAALAITGVARPDPLPFAVTPLALAPFLLDGTFTLFRRLCRGEAIWRAHRTHLYQRAVGSGRAHHDVLLPWACWIAVAAATACGAAVGDGRAALGGCVAMLVAFGAMWRWVVRCEAQTHGKSAAREPLS
jgi:Fuc2NAc and GlcNAc transferase